MVMLALAGGTWLSVGPVLAADTAVSIVDFAFNPSAVSIQVNDSVTWTWIGPTPHTTTSNAGLWDSGLMSASSPRFSYTFKSSGSFPYFCTIHPFMTASVSVNAAPPSGADLAIALSAAPDPVAVSNQLTYTVLISNTGPADAPDVVVTDSLPSEVTFISASTSQGSATQSVEGWRWDAGPLASGVSATASIVVRPMTGGSLTNTAFVLINNSAVTDPNSANNTAAVVTSIGQTGPPGPTNLAIQAIGTILFNRQTGLFEQSVPLSNLSSNSIAAVRVAVLGLPASVTLYNGSGSANGTPFVEYDHAVGPGSNVDFRLEYYSSNRLSFVSTNFAATVVAPATPTAVEGTLLSLDRDPFLFNGALVIEFSSTPGRTYFVQYSADMQTWSTSVPPIVAAGTRVQWIDAGPPKTSSPPGAAGQRFYRIVQSP